MLTRRKFMKLAFLSTTTMSLGLQIVGCDGDGDDPNPVEFALISDIHLYDSTLGTTGEAFEIPLHGPEASAGERGHTENPPLTPSRVQAPSSFLSAGI
jgi:hypothetical protein